MSRLNAMQRLLEVARGSRPADIVVRNARLVDVLTGTIQPTDVGIFEGRIAAVGRGLHGVESIDASGSYVAPGLIDAHVHVESSLCLPGEFARPLLARGVTSVVADPHEVANVCGIAGVRGMVQTARASPLRFVFMAPSCVPATRLASGGATLETDEIAALIRDETVSGIAEVMNYPGVVAGDPAMLQRIDAAQGRPIDGHAPGLSGLPLCAYAASGIGTDHECTTAAEALEKLSRGLRVFIREATGAKNLNALLPIINKFTLSRLAFCTDDRHPGDLLVEGSVDHMVRRAIAAGIEPIDALRIASLGAAEAHDLRDRGAIAPGKAADLFLFDDLNAPRARLVMVRGKVVSRDGELPASLPSSDVPGWGRGACRVAPGAVRFDVQAQGGQIHVIGVIPGQLLTELRRLRPRVEQRLVVADPERDVLKFAMLDRYGRNEVGIGFVQGLGIRRGAIGGTIAHDHHNLAVIGADDGSMRTVIAEISRMGGGLAAAAGDAVLESLPLPVAGLMSHEPLETVAARYDRLLDAASHLGARLHDPFMMMSFLGLEVIPRLKLTPGGLVDVNEMRFIGLFTAEADSAEEGMCR
jgi:adenine deaminase